MCRIYHHYKSRGISWRPLGAAPPPITKRVPKKKERKERERKGERENRERNGQRKTHKKEG